MGSSARKTFYGWWALSGAMLVYFCGCALCFYSFGVFLPLLCQDLDLSRAVVGGVYSLFMVLMGIVGPLVGFSVGRFGARKNIIFGNLVSVIGLASLYLVNGAWQLFLLFGVLVGLGQGFGMFIPATTVANNWFIRRRSLAVALVISAGAIGGFAGPQVTNMLISNMGWRLAWVCLGSILLALSVIIGGLFLIRNRPEDLGQSPNGEVRESTEDTSLTVAPTTKVYQTPMDWETGDALRTRAIWMFLMAAIAHTLAINTIFAHLMAYLEDLGFSSAIAAFVMGIVPGMSIIGRLSTGFLAMRFEVRYLVAIYLSMMLVAMVILVTTTSITMLYVYSVLFGISYGAFIPAGPTLISAYYGRTNYPEIIGWTMPLGATIGAIAGPLAGAVYESTGSYIPWFIVVSAFLGLGAVIAFLARPPKPRDLS